MATYWEDWSGYTVGDNPTTDGPAGWTARWATSGLSVQVLEDASAPAGKSLRITKSAGSRSLLSYDAVDGDAARANCEVRALIRVRAATAADSMNFFGCVGRGAGAAAAESGYVANTFRGSPDGSTRNARIATYNSGAAAFSQQSASTTLYSTGDLIWVRLRANGTTLLWGVAPDSGGVPGTETTSSDTNSALSAAGWLGLFSFSSGAEVDVLAVGFGTDGDAAPISAPATPVEFTGTVLTQTYTVNAAITPLDLSGFFSGTETPFTYSVQSGTLPTGLSLNSSTGVISGTPTTVAGPTSIVVRATDDATDTADTNSFTIEIEAAASVVKGVRVRLYDNADAAAASITGIQCAWFDQPEPKDFLAPEYVTSTASTDADGWLELDLDSATGLAVAAAGFLVAYKLDGTEPQDSPVFAGRLVIEDIA